MTRYFFRGKQRVPFEPAPGLVGVSTVEEPEEFLGAADPYAAIEAEPVSVGEEVRAQGVRVFGLTAPLRGAAAVDPSKTIEALERLEHVESAGAVLQLEDDLVSFLTRQVVVRLASAGADAEAIAGRHGFEVRRRLLQSPNGYVLRSRAPATYELLDRTEALAAEPDVEWCEPSLVTTSQMDAIVPAAYLWPGEWDRQLVGVEGGWQALDDAGVHPFGDPNIVIAIVDQGVKSEDGVPVHPDFRGPLSDGGDKVVALHDFHATRADNDAAQGDHGVGVAGIATAHSSLADGDQPQQGVVGAAPNCRIIGLIFPRNEVDQLDMYLWAAGFDPESDRAGFPEPLERGADVFSTSIGFGAGAPISQLASDTLAFIAREGRAGKGCPMFFSAGNAGNEFTSYRPWAAHPDTFGMGASSLDDDGQTEIRARYSGWGPVDLCAPSNDGRPMRHDPPRSYATWTCHLPGRGDLIGAPAAQTDLTETAAAGARSLGVDSADGFHEGANVMIGSPGAPGAEVSTIDEVDAGAGTITIRPALRREHPLGEPLATGERGYRSDFGGTSSATPLAAGVAALVLSANPELSIDELRELLRNTAVRIALDTDDEVGRWLDSDGNPVTESGEPAVRSQWFGHGRIDAAAAVRAVLELRAAPPPVVPPDAPGGG